MFIGQIGAQVEQSKGVCTIDVVAAFGKAIFYIPDRMLVAIIGRGESAVSLICSRIKSVIAYDWCFLAEEINIHQLGVVECFVTDCFQAGGESNGLQVMTFYKCFLANRLKRVGQSDMLDGCVVECLFTYTLISIGNNNGF